MGIGIIEIIMVMGMSILGLGPIVAALALIWMSWKKLTDIEKAQRETAMLLEEIAASINRHA